MSLRDRAFWLAALERAIKTVAQVAVTLIGAELVGFAELDWAQIASVSSVAGVVSLLTSVGSDAYTATPGPSLTSVESTQKPRTPGRYEATE